MKKVIIGIIGLLLLCGIIAVVASQSKTPTTIQQGSVSKPTTVARAEPTAKAVGPTVAAKQSIGSIGQKVVSAGTALEVVSAKRSAETFDSIFEPKEGNEFLFAEVVVENVSRDKMPYNPLYFKVKDSDGYEYGPALSAPGNVLRTGELLVGDKARGTVAFEVPKSAKGFTLSYQPLVILGGYETIRFKLD